MKQNIYYIRFALQFADKQIPELVNIFNSEVQSRGWTSMRAYHDWALIDEFINRGIDTSIISDGNSINFAHPIAYNLFENKLVLIN